MGLGDGSHTISEMAGCFFLPKFGVDYLSTFLAFVSPKNVHWKRSYSDKYEIIRKPLGDACSFPDGNPLWGNVHCSSNSLADGRDNLPPFKVILPLSARRTLLPNGAGVSSPNLPLTVRVRGPELTTFWGHVSLRPLIPWLCWLWV